jgi:hypothetical protein
MLMVVVMMVIIRRTGGVVHLSTARLAGMAAAILHQDHAQRQIARQQEQLARQRHLDLPIGDELLQRPAPS